jgi:hypothetical protein
MFGSSVSQSNAGYGGFSTSQHQPSVNFFGANTAQPATTPNFMNAAFPQSSQPATGGFGAFGATASAPATTAPNMFTNVGATVGQLQRPAFGAGFVQPTAQPETTAGTGSGAFGQGTSAFSQTNGDTMLSTPQIPPPKPLGWNKQTPNGIVGTPNSSGSESPDRPPHIEQVEDVTPPNVFANLQRPPPQPAPTPTATQPKPTATSLFSFNKPDVPNAPQEPEKQPQKEKENEQPSFFTSTQQSTSKASSNPFGSLQLMSDAQKTPSLSTPSQPEKSNPSGMFTQGLKLTDPLASPPASSTIRYPAGLSTAQKPAENAPAREASPQKRPNSPEKQARPPSNGLSGFGGWGKLPSDPPKFYQPSPGPQPQPMGPKGTTASALGPELFSQLLPELLREDNLPPPNTQGGITEEEKKYHYQAHKIDRLNKSIIRMLSMMPRTSDLSAVCFEYVCWMQEIKKATQGSRLGDLISVHGEIEGRRRYDQEQGRVPMDGTNKRKASPPEEEENEKRLKMNGDVAQSDTASKFQSILQQAKPNDNAAPAPSSAFGFSNATATPSKTSAIFAQAAASPAAPPLWGNPFGNDSASSAQPTTSNMFGNATASTIKQPASNTFGNATSSPARQPASNMFGNPSGSPAPRASNMFGNKEATSTATPTQSNATSLFSTGAATTTTPAAPGFTRFEPSTTLTTSGAVKAPGFTHFEPRKTLTPSDAAKAPVSPGFKPITNLSPSTALALPKFGNGPTNFLSQFSKNAEEEAKKAKREAFRNDYDSDEETKEEWEARYEKKQEEKRKQISAASSVVGFRFTPTSSVAGSNAGSADEGEIKTSSSFLALPAAGNHSRLSRSASPLSPASPEGSVFDQPQSSTPGTFSRDNPFAQFSRQASEKGDADDEQESADDDEIAGQQEEEEEDQESTPRASNGVVSRRGPFEDDSDGSELETPEQRTDGLFGRVSRDSPGDRTPLATTGANQGSILGTAGPANQIWTPKDPIKFASNNIVKEGEKSAIKPLFNFTPAGGSRPQGVLSGLFPGSKESAPPPGVATPSNPFGSTVTPMAKATPATSLLPPSSATSVFNTPIWGSRATTPFSDLSGAESTATEAEGAKLDPQIVIADIDQDKEGHEVIFEASKVKATRFDQGEEQQDDGEEGRKAGWHVVGVGPVVILKSEETGVVSMLMRSVPSSKIIINTRMAGVLNPQVLKKRARFVIVTQDGPQSYLISFLTEEDSQAFVEACKANGAK